ncbi:hypothetical protein GCK72_012572 [Caenorhabditis remanei]|uniref:Uncharacterized protein n=1 Tax=Caenorhabditis remanei TaxID=31234 RepID=E3NLJ5_CAERE|nr:hypothetical protein GCK72_012572 [Caenorhabditis remanei]EFP04921.1 hypothetical protein CRE_12383 [Caenorhabditis remanei]KAF1756119.1 hypothetical protein GCK72_012572 [Caenorhabditis remanei]
MATSYLTESLAGPTSARGSSYSYSYESHYDNPPEEEYEHFTNDDGVHQMQKVSYFEFECWKKYADEKSETDQLNAVYGKCIVTW